MIYQFERSEIKRCDGCDFFFGGVDGMSYEWGYCTRQEDIIDGHKTPQENDCLLVAISKTETTSCENGKTKTEKKYDNFRSYNIQGDCYKYVCSCIGCGQVLWEIEDYNYMKGERGCKPPFCPNCGRRLEADNGSDLY